MGRVDPESFKKDEKGLNRKQRAFCVEYVKDKNGTQAAIRAGYSEATAHSQCSDLLQKPEVRELISELTKAKEARTGITADRVLLEAWNIATADTRELVDVKSGCCRYCHGIGNRYQFTTEEMNTAREKWTAEGKAMSDFDEKGGIGFHINREPNPDCPECGGDGVSRVVVKDTRNISAAAMSLFAGAKQTKDGVEVKFHSKDAMMEKLFKHLGLYEKDNGQKVDPMMGLATIELLKMRDMMRGKE